MPYTTVNEDEYAMRNCWPKGWYPCKIVKCEEGRSQKGNSYFKCENIVYNASGHQKYVTSYLNGEGAAAWQLRSAAEAFGLLEQYRAGTLTPHDLIEKTAYCKVAIEEDETGQYEPKNKIADYRDKMPKKAGEQAVPATGKPDVDDEIPF